MTNTLWRGTVALLFLLLLGSTAVLAMQNRRLTRENRALHERATRPYAGIVVPEARTVTLGGDSVTLGAPHRGERELLFFFTTTCPFCRSAMPSWRALVKEVAGRYPVRAYAVALDAADSLEAYAEHAGVQVPVVRPIDPRFFHLYRSKAVPLTLVVGDSGRVLYSRFGVLDTLVHMNSLLAALGSPAPLGLWMPEERIPGDRPSIIR